MKTRQGIHVDLICMANNQVPLGIETPETNFLRMPHGKFGVRIVTSRDTEVTVHMGDKSVLSAKVQKGKALLTESADGKAFEFTGSGEQTVASPDETTTGTTADTQSSDNHGFVAVSVRFADETVVHGPQPQSDIAETICFQMNPPGKKHNACVAANLHRIIPPEGVTHSGCSCCH
jgi:hypothetical protein